MSVDWQAELKHIHDSLVYFRDRSSDILGGWKRLAEYDPYAALAHEDGTMAAAEFEVANRFIEHIQGPAHWGDPRELIIFIMESLRDAPRTTLLSFYEHGRTIPQVALKRAAFELSLERSFRSYFRGKGISVEPDLISPEDQ